MKYDYLIVGGGVAGVTAAETIRENDPAGSIAIVSDEPYILYSRVMLSKPNFFLGKIPFNQVWLKGKEWYGEKKIDFLGGKTANKIDLANKVLSLTDGAALNYEKLLLAPGVCTRKTTVTGADKKGVHYLRTLDDGKGIMENLKTAKQAVTVGGGFISFEMTDLLHLAGLETTLLLRENYFWEPILDETSGLMIESAMTKAGIKILKQTEIVEIGGGENVESVTLKSGEKIACQLVIFGIGVENPIGWIKESGVGTNRGILANEYLETSAPNVWTAGDIAEYKDLILGEIVQLGNWVNAHKQGEIAGLNMVASFDKLRINKQPFKFVSFYTTSGFDLSIAFVGDPSLALGTSPRAVIKRGSPEINSYARIIVENNELIGATLINRTAEMGLIAKLIEQNVDVSAHLSELSDVNFDLKGLVS